MIEQIALGRELAAGTVRSRIGVFHTSAATTRLYRQIVGLKQCRPRIVAPEGQQVGDRAADAPARLVCGKRSHCFMIFCLRGP
jgi:hypothetical protein